MLFNVWVYRKLKPYWSRLENSVRKLEREYLQALEYKKADEARKKFRDGMTPEKYKHLTTRPLQSECHHAKGGRGPRAAYFNDYAISHHTFPDGHVEVKCLICGKQFDPKDPETMKMVNRSTNTPTASEYSFSRRANGPDSVSS
jgi:hypothetical protein